MNCDSPYVLLKDIPPGSIFETVNGVRAVKSEYYNSNTDSQPLCVLLTSGEFAHFPKGRDEAVRVINH